MTEVYSRVLTILIFSSSESHKSLPPFKYMTPVKADANSTHAAFHPLPDTRNRTLYPTVRAMTLHLRFLVRVRLLHIEAAIARSILNGRMCHEYLVE